MLSFMLLVCMLAVTQAQLPNKKLPSFLKVCHQSDPDLNSCIKSSVEQLQPHLAIGIPELLVPSCDPLYVPELLVHQGHGTIGVDYTYTDVLIHGLSDFILHSVRVDLEKEQMEVNLTLPELRITGNYTVSGQVLMLPIVGNGYSSGNYSDIKALALIQWERVTRFGKVYLHVVDFLLDFTIGHASIYLADLFNGDKELGDAMNLFINENWKKIAEDVKPVLEDTFGRMLKDFANKMFLMYTMDELLPP